jgi:glycosyltransferase involved in cell wall biosynthesis
MRILHIAYVDHRSDSGISVAVPRHIKHQAKYADVSLLNITDFIPDNAEGIYPVYSIKKGDTLTDLLHSNDAPDLVVFHEIYRPYFIRAYKEILKEGIPYVIIPHGSLTRGAQLESKWKKRFGNFALFNKFINLSSDIQYMSETEASQSTAIKKPYFVQGSGIDIVGRKKYDFLESGLKIVYIGRLDIHVKGLDILLEAARDNKELFIKNDIAITIAGSDSKGGHRKIRKYIDKYKLDKLITLEGPIYGAAKVKKLLEHDLFIQISRTEAQCLGLMEAMDLGLPSIVSPGSTFFEIAKQYKIAIPSEGNSNDVSQAVLSAVSNKDMLNTLSRNASKYIADNYAWDRVARLMVEHYEGIFKVSR